MFHTRFLHFLCSGGLHSEPYHCFGGKSSEIGRQHYLANSGDTPAVSPLVFDTGIKGESVVAGGCGAAGVGLEHLFHRNNFVGPCPQLGGPGNGITWLQGVQVSKVILYTPVVACNTNIPIPDAGAGSDRPFWKVPLSVPS